MISVSTYKSFAFTGLLSLRIVGKVRPERQTIHKEEHND